MSPGINIGDDTYPLMPEHRKSMDEIMQRLDKFAEALDRLCAEHTQDRQLVHLLLMLWGIDPNNPQSVAEAYSSRLKIIDARRAMVFITGGGFVAAMIAAITWLPSLWRLLK